MVKLYTYLGGLNKRFICINIAALLEDHQLLRKVKRNFLRQPITGLEKALELAGARLLVTCRNFIALNKS